MSPEPCAVSLHSQYAPPLAGVRSGMWFVVHVLEEVIWSLCLVLHLPLLMQVLTPNQRPANLAKGSLSSSSTNQPVSASQAGWYLGMCGHARFCWGLGI